MTFNPEISTNKENSDVLPSANVDIFYMRHGKPEGKYAHDDMPYDEFYKALDYSSSLNIKLDEKSKENVIASLNESGIENHDILIYLNGDHSIFIERALKRNWNVKLEKDLINEAILKSSDTLIRKYLKNIDKRIILSLDTSKIDIRDRKNIEMITKKITEMNSSKN